MSNPIIQINNLSKSYEITHEGRERYTTFRDVMSKKAKKIFSFPKTLSSTLNSTFKEEFWALKNISFDINAGDRVGIIGRNGAGKSTLLKILSRITEPTTGQIKIKGRVASLLEVGTGFHPELSGRENIFLNGAILGMSRAEIKKHFDAIVDFSEIEKFLDTPVKRYSSGMYVRLAFAVAAHLEPEILVVDEVLAVGDAQFQKKCLGKMEDVSKNEGRTVILVSHDVSKIIELCNNCIILNKGILVDTGNAIDMVRKYKSQTINSGYNKNTKEKNIIDILDLQIYCNGDQVFKIENLMPYTFLLYCEAFKEIDKVSFAICFNNINQFRSVSFWSKFVALPFNLTKGKFIVEFEISRFHLIPGTYEVIIYIERNGESIQSVKEFAEIYVIHNKALLEFEQPKLETGIYIEDFKTRILKC